MDERDTKMQSKEHDQRPGQLQNGHLGIAGAKAIEVVEGLQASHTKSQDNAANEKGTQSGKSTASNLGYNAVDQSQGNGTDNLVQIQQNKHGGSLEPNSYHIAFPKISNNFENHAKKDQLSELAPYTVVQTIAARLRHNQAHHCKYTLIEKFSSTMPKMELIRKSFIMQTQLIGGGGNLAHYNARHVLIDLENELDYNTVWTQQRMTTECKLMRIQT
ncbi:hypothetical protein H5410_027592 [Solanum commersonii]|uniref:DUF4283 domain-containing protein n=1 Tax=Solanum commersonii TaxID=4109 RepID=A0A9J5Z3T6_SOLCO|nr:hypothetical protein H5410_027592 [Solanum commersonii]